MNRTVTRSNSPRSGPRHLFEGHGLVCVRGERVVFSNLDFSLEDGGALLLVGPNGSGKSSLLRLMAGLLHSAAGELSWNGEALGGDREGHGARTRYVGHHDAVKPVLSVAENIAFWVRLWSPDTRDVEAAVHRALELFDMARLADVPGKLLSAGQKRRVNLARLIAAPAPLWLLDEPTTALDKTSVAVVEAAVAEHRAGGGMIVLSTHTDVRLPGAAVLAMDDFATDDEAWPEFEPEPEHA